MGLVDTSVDYDERSRGSFTLESGEGNPHSMCNSCTTFKMHWVSGVQSAASVNIILTTPLNSPAPDCIMRSDAVCFLESRAYTTFYMIQAGLPRFQWCPPPQDLLEAMWG